MLRALGLERQPGRHSCTNARVHRSTGGDQVTAWLLKRGANPNLQTGFGAHEGVTPLHVCAWPDRLDMARELIARGADHASHDATHDGAPLGWAEHMGSERVDAYLRLLAWPVVRDMILRPGHSH